MTKVNYYQSTITPQKRVKISLLVTALCLPAIFTKASSAIATAFMLNFFLKSNTLNLIFGLGGSSSLNLRKPDIVFFDNLEKLFAAVDENDDEDAVGADDVEGPLRRRRSINFSDKLNS